MTGGYGAVPNELYQAANKIGDVVGAAAGLQWQGPSGDYGHAGVQAGWSTFLSDLETHVKELRDKADHHGESLKTAAGSYTEAENTADHSLGKLGDLFDDSSGGGLRGVPGGGFTGGITGILGGGEAADTGGMLYEPTNGAGLHDVPGGGFTGNLTPSQLDERLGKQTDEAHSGVMSPERSQELFPDSSIDRPTPRDGEGPVY
jgi:hypothetical protein